MREYAPRGQQPNFDYAVPESRERVWFGLCGNGELIGPVFFDRSVSGPSYLQMLNEEVLPHLLQTFGYHFRDGKCRSLQGTSTPLSGVRDWLLEFFLQDHIIALCHQREWPPRSPDLTPNGIIFNGAI